MSNFLIGSGLAKAYGAQTLFANISFVISDGDRIGVIGPNGSGKSTLLKILCGWEEADQGQITQQKQVRIGYLAQEDIFNESQTIIECLHAAMVDDPSEESEKYNRINTILSRADFIDPQIEISRLSGGWRKRLAICRAMLNQPDLLVMDEPTNHLDIEGILWLEKILSGPMAPGAYLVVSHDRRFLENCTNRMIELSRVYPEGTLQIQGPYSKFLEMREEFLVGQQLE
jgi:ATP-binding cassette subfamily F protein uup